MAGPYRKKINPTIPVLNLTRNHVEVVDSGIERSQASSTNKDALRVILGIEGEAVGTLNTQELFNKTQDGGTYS
jgi:hypothetical protein